MSESQDGLEQSQNSNDYERTIGRFVIGASAGVFAGGLGGFLGFEIGTHVFHRIMEALPMIGSPALGVGVLYGIRAIRRNN